MNETCFSVGALAVLAPIVAALATVVGVLYRDGIKSRDREISSCSLLLREANERLNQGIPAMDEAETVLRGKIGGRRRS